MATLGPNPWVNPFEKCQFVDFLNFLFLELRKACFGSGISFKTFSWLILPKKKKWKNGYFWAKTMGNPFKKCQFFDFLKFLFLQIRNSLFGSRISLKTFSWAKLPKKKKLEKWPFLGQNHGLTRLEKCQFFYFLNFLFLQLRKAFFGSRISLNIIFLG